MKMCNYTSVTRRKLIKVILDIGKEYYVFTDGSDYNKEDDCQRALEFTSKDVLLDVLRLVLYRGYRRFADGHDAGLIVHCAVCLTSRGVIMPHGYELPTSEGIKLIVKGLQEWMPSVVGLSSPL